MYIYEGSPRRSPRRMEVNRDSNILKPKQTSPIRKGMLSSKGNIIPSSSAALSSITSAKRKPSSKVSNPSTATNGQRKVVRRKNENDENKENCNVAPRVPRATGLGVNGSTAKKSQPLGAKVAIPGRLPLKEIPLNGFLDRLRKQEVATSVEIMSTVVDARQEARRTEARMEQPLRRGLDNGVGVGNDWESSDMIR